MHCIFRDKYGSLFHYRWTAPWREKEGEHGIHRLFFKSLEIEEWNDYEGVWSEEFKKVAKEVPPLEDIELPIKIEMAGITEVACQGKEALWEISVAILSDKEEVVKVGDQGIRVGAVEMAWYSLQVELYSIAEIEGIPNGIVGIYDDYGCEIGVCFPILIRKVADKAECQIISRGIASCIRHFIRGRLSEYKAIKRGFEEQG